MKAAVFWDVENIAPTKNNHVLEDIEKWLQVMGEIKYKIAVSNCFSVKRERLIKIYESGYGLECIPKREKNATDKIIIKRIKERMILDKEINLYVIITQDSDFAKIIKKLKEKGKYVVLFHAGNNMRKSFKKLPHKKYNIKEKCNFEKIEDVIESMEKRKRKKRQRRKNNKKRKIIQKVA